MVQRTLSLYGPRPIFFGSSGTDESGRVFAERAQLGQFADRGFIVVAPSDNANGAVWPIWDDMRMEGDTRPNADIALHAHLIAVLGGRSLRRPSTQLDHRDPSGHYWLPINDWFAYRLLEHPKGVPGHESDFAIPPSPVAGIECSAAAFLFGSGAAQAEMFGFGASMRRPAAAA